MAETIRVLVSEEDVDKINGARKENERRLCRQTGTFDLC